MMAKRDLRKELRQLYLPSTRGFSLVEVPPLFFAMIDGRGDPNKSPDFQEAIEALYSISYTLKFMAKKSLGQDYTVMPLEALWWTTAEGTLDMSRKTDWYWTAMLLQPDFTVGAPFDAALEQARSKKDLPAFSRLRLERFSEGLSAQILYIGPYADEEPTIKRMHEFIEKEGYEPAGKHHEIYLGDPRRTAPQRLKTVIRVPVRRRG
jgi:hypothetical protein